MAVKGKEKLSSENAILASIWKEILKKSGVMKSLPFLINEYADSRKESAYFKRKKKSSVVATATSDEITWTGLMFLLTQVLRVRKFKVTIEVEIRGKSVSVEKDINIARLEEDE